MITDQDSGGFLPPTTIFTDQLHRQPPSSSTTPTGTTSNVSCTTQESDLATAIIHRAIIKIRDAVAAATTVNPTTTARRNPLRRTVSDITTPPATNREEGPKIKRLRKMEDVVMEIKQRCKDIRSEYEEQENVGDDNPSKANMEPDQGGEECVGFKRLDEDEEECVGFNRLDDGALRIKMRCLCHKHFEILHNHIGCFYRLI